MQIKRIESFNGNGDPEYIACRHCLRHQHMLENDSFLNADFIAVQQSETIIPRSRTSYSRTSPCASLALSLHDEFHWTVV